MAVAPLARKLRRSLRANWVTFGRYLVCGVVTFAIYLLVLVGLIEALAFPRGLAAGLSVLLGGVANYIMVKYVVFESTRRHTEAVPRYIAVILANAATNAVVTWVASDVAGLPYGPVQVVYLAIATVTIYWLMKHRVMFRRHAAVSEDG